MKRRKMGRRLIPVILTGVAALLGINLFCMLQDTTLGKNWSAKLEDWESQMVCEWGIHMSDRLLPASSYLTEAHGTSLMGQFFTYMVQAVPVKGYYGEISLQQQEGRNPFETETQTREPEKTILVLEEQTSPVILEDTAISELLLKVEEESSVEELPGTEDTGMENTGMEETAPVQVRTEGNLVFYEPQKGKEIQSKTVEAWQAELISASAYPIEKLKDFDYLMQKFYAVRETTSIRSGELSVDQLLSYDSQLTSDNGKPQILIYHAHSQEEFCDYVQGEGGHQILDVGSYLCQLLSEQYGYSVIHDTTPYDMKEGKLDKNEAYTYAGEGVEALLASYPSIEVLIDLHRDGVAEGVHLITEVNGKQTAKLMFVNGISRDTMQGEIAYLYNPYISQNIAFSFQLQLKASSMYPELIKRTMISAYRYNLHYREKSLLVEVGAQTNTTQEAMNAMEPLAKLLSGVLG